MKAWVVKDPDEFAASIVFAETRGKAKALAMGTDACEDVPFIRISAKRRPELDKYYVPGKTELYWFKADDRIALVKDGGFVCCDEYFEVEECPNCPACEYCDKYKDSLAEMEDNV